MIALDVGGLRSSRSRTREARPDGRASFICELRT